MKTYFVLGGYGEMGRIASRDLAETAKGAKIIIAGRDGKKAKQYARKLGKNVAGVYADAAKTEELAKILKNYNADVVINCALYYYNLDVMRACLLAGCHYLDLGGLFHMTRKQLKLHSKFKKRKLIAILGCGSTPGITNVMAGYAAGHMDKVHEIHVRFAGHSFTKQKKHFVVPYSLYTVFDEFTSKPAILAGGKIRFVPPVSGRSVEHFPLPIGQAATFYTLHSELATFPSSFRSKGLMECDFKLAFDEDFVHDVRLMVEAGMASKKYVTVAGKNIRPVDISVKELNRFIPDNKNVKDIEYVRVRLTGEKYGKQLEIVMDCLARSNAKWKASAGDVDTGVPPSIIAQMIASGKIKERGVLPPERCVPPVQFFHELAKRGMQIITTTRCAAFG